MVRRLASMLGIVVLVALALVLLWRVYVHHERADPYERGPETIVERETISVKIANGSFQIIEKLTRENLA